MVVRARGARRGGRPRGYLCIYVPCPNRLLFIHPTQFISTAARCALLPAPRRIAVVEGLDQSWARLSKMPYIDLQTSNDATRWLVSVYFATLTVTTIGYGEGFFKLNFKL